MVTLPGDLDFATIHMFGTFDGTFCAQKSLDHRYRKTSLMHIMDW